MTLDDAIAGELGRLVAERTFKEETAIDSAQGPLVRVGGREVVMLASNNYLGLASDPRIADAAIRGIRDYGYGVSSVRFICGTLTIHRRLEEQLAQFLGAEDSILFSSCYAANEAFFASIVNESLGYRDYTDVIYSDRLNHASIIDGTRLCRSQSVDRKIYEHGDTEDLARLLEADRDRARRFGFVATDGVFSMEGDLAPLPELVPMAREAGCLLFVDDSHGVGVLGATGRGTPEALGVHGQVSVLGGTFGKALGGAGGGYIAGGRDLVSYLRQKARPYVFSNSLPPAIVIAAIESLRILTEDAGLVGSLVENTRYFRAQVRSLGFRIPEGSHPIVPVIVGEASVAMEMSRALLADGVYVKGLWYPVVPEGEARLRAQVSAAHSRDHLDRALGAFERAGRKMRVI
jgi:glycine C-acetyltransferase